MLIRAQPLPLYNESFMQFEGHKFFFGNKICELHNTPMSYMFLSRSNLLLCLLIHLSFLMYQLGELGKGAGKGGGGGGSVREAGGALGKKQAAEEEMYFRLVGTYSILYDQLVVDLFVCQN